MKEFNILLMQFNKLVDALEFLPNGFDIAELEEIKKELNQQAQKFKDKHGGILLKLDLEYQYKSQIMNIIFLFSSSFDDARGLNVYYKFHKLR